MGSNPIARSKHSDHQSIGPRLSQSAGTKAGRYGVRAGVLGAKLPGQQNHAQDRCDAPGKTIEPNGIVAPGFANEGAHPNT